eukprot:14425179-Ditylum_brightwellii.AAC.1
MHKQPRELGASQDQPEPPKEPTEKKERKRNKRGTNNPHGVPISHPIQHNMELQVPEGVNLHHNGPNSGSKGEECLATEQGRSKVGPMLKKHENALRSIISKILESKLEPKVDLKNIKQKLPKLSNNAQ